MGDNGGTGMGKWGKGDGKWGQGTGDRKDRKERERVSGWQGRHPIPNQREKAGRKTR